MIYIVYLIMHQQMGGTLPDYINEMIERVLKNGK